MITIHCSALPRVCSCPASLLEPDLTIQGDSDNAALGSAVHAALAAHVRGEIPNLNAIAEKYGVDRSALAPPFFTGLRAWESLVPDIEVIGVELSMEMELVPGVLRLQGTADVVGGAPKERRPTLAIVDWKYGIERDYTEQLQGYAVLARPRWGAEVYKIIPVYLLDGNIDIQDMDADAAQADLTAKLMKSIAHPNRFTPTFANCEFCPRQLDCRARRALVRQSVLDISNVADTIDALPASKLAELYPRVKFIQKVCDHFDATFRNAVAVAGELPGLDGQVYYLKDGTRTPIDTAKALPVLMRYFGDVSQIASALTIAKGDLIELVKARRPKGQKVGECVKEFQAALDAAGAVTPQPYKILSVKKGEVSNENV